MIQLEFGHGSSLVGIEYILAQTEDSTHSHSLCLSHLALEAWSSKLTVLVGF